jgi:DNA-binding CsgD family transcriptional regulator/tetratricopeptide (TPR) repeat protein
LGAFEEARADLEKAWEAAQGEHLAEWQALLDLGMLWASRDYARTGDYYRRALEVARTVDDAAILARTLNHMGNWHTNIEEMDEALRYHREALEIFQKLEHRQGIAQTSDLLGMAHLVGGDAVQGAAYFQQAVTLFDALNDLEGMASPLGTLPLCGASYTTDTVVSSSLTAAERLEACARARQIAVEIGWRAGEAYSWIGTSYSWVMLGDYGRALEAGQRGVAIAEEIEHRQWMSHSHRHLGAIYVDLFALPQARQHLEHALVLAEQIGSTVHRLSTVGHLFSLLVLEQNFVEADALVATYLDPLLPARTMVQRRCWQAQVELALARGDPDLALHLIDRLVASAANLTSGGIGAIPYLAKLQGEALVALQRWEEAEATLLAALATARQLASPRLLWRLHASLGSLYQAQARNDEAANAFAAAGEIVDAIAATLPAPELVDTFLRHTAALMPQRQARSGQNEQAIANSSLSLTLPSSPPATQYPAGLTSREVEVLRFVVQGATNRQIAAALHISDRTVNTHLTHILNKIGCDNRTAAAAFALQHGLV